MEANLRTPERQAEVTGLREAAGGDCCVPLDSGSMHDLLSPGTQVCFMADLVLQKHQAGSDYEAVTLLTFVKESADPLHNLVKGLQTCRQIVGLGGPFRRCDANLLLAATLAIMASSIKESGAVVTHDPLPELNCDSHQITYTFACVIQNSIKFRGTSTPEIHVSAVPLVENIVFSFRDNAIGIDPWYREHIFGVFRPPHHDNYPSAGMGLAIAKGVVKRHGGLIWVESTVGQGATSYLELPVAENIGTYS